MIIDKIHIKKFRAIQDQEFEMGRWLTGIFGRNQTQKSTLLGIISQGFSIPKTHKFSKEKTLDGYNFKSQMAEKFKFDLDHEEIGSHYWTLYLNKSVKNHILEYPIKSYQRYSNNIRNPIRFWYAKNKTSKVNYVERPVYFLSLKRLYPIGESTLDKKSPIKPIPVSLHKEFTKAYVNILTDCSVTPIIAKKGKESFEGVNALEYSYLTNSAGQGNVAKIIIAILSFQNLKDKYPNDYNGGILLIDELDVTLHPWAQRKMLEFLKEKAKTLDLQIVFTSHSKVMLDALKKLSLPDPSGKNYKVLFLEKKDTIVNVTDIHNMRGYKEVEADLELVEYKPEKIKVYCEDITASKLIRSILPNDIKKRISFETISLGLQQYITLYHKKFYDLQRGIIVMDGDWKNVLCDEQKNIVKKAKTIMPLPEEECFEVAIYKLIKNLTDKQFEEYFHHKRSVVLKNFLPSVFDLKSESLEEQKNFAKNFFKQTEIQKQLLTYWKKKYPNKCKIFIEEFVKAFNLLAKRLEIDPI